MLDPKSIQDPSDLPESLTLSAEGDETLEISLPRKFGFDFHWLHEVSLGKLQGGLGVRIWPEAEANLQLTLRGSLRRVISLDERKWLRLQVFKREDREFLFASGVSVTAQAKTPPAERFEELAAALLGVHQEQWLSLGSVAPAAVERGLRNYSEFERLDGRVQKQLRGLFGSIKSDAGLVKVAGKLRAVLALKDSIYQKAVVALERKFKAAVSCRYRWATEDAALVDCSFDFTEEGLEAYRRALDGDYSAALGHSSAHVRVRQAILTHQLGQESVVELHLPFLGRREWARRLDAFPRMEVESGEDGRVLVYQVEATDRVTSRNAYQSTLALAGSFSAGGQRTASTFTLSYSDTRKLACRHAGAALAPVLAGYGFDEGVGRWLDEPQAAAGDVEASLSLSVPASLAAAWCDAPGEREPSFFEVYSRVSLAVQRAMRRWLPYVYFENVERYESLGAAFPLLVYRASRPYSGRPRSYFTYDVLNDGDLAKVLKTAARALPRELARVQSNLLAVGRGKTAGFYHPAEAEAIVQEVQRKPLQLKSLLVADAFFVDALIKLGCKGREVRRKIETGPRESVKDLVRFAAQFAKTFHGKLRRLYGGGDFLPLGSLLLVEATNALGTGKHSESAIQAVLRVRRGQGGPEQTFVNQAYRV